MSSSLSYGRPLPAHKRRRRTATSVLAGDFDPRPARDVLTSLLNGVPRYDVVEKKEEDSKRAKKKERRERDRERLRAKRAEEKVQREEALLTNMNGLDIVGDELPEDAPEGEDDMWTPFDPDMGPEPAARRSRTPTARPFALPEQAPPVRLGPSRPSINMIAPAQRSISITPPPMPVHSSPASTPGPSISSTVSRNSSKRPHTPDDGESVDYTMPPPAPAIRRRKRSAARKGWKGWVEGSPPPSDKLINLDSVQVITERRTRSGRNFDA